MVAEDVTITEEVQVVLEAKEVLAVAVSEEKEVQHQEAEALEAREVQRREKVDLAEEEKVVFLPNAHPDVQMHLDQADFLKERQDVQKVLLTDQEKEDQEKTNTFC